MADEWKYDVFISYRHVKEDERIAKMLEHQFERYHIPSGIRKEKGRTCSRVFRDQDELPVTDNLDDKIRAALNSSEFLVVICSVHTRDSRWVKKEIEIFLETHSQEKVLTVLVNGEPRDVIPESLLSRREKNRDGQMIETPVEPRFCDYRGNLRKAKRTEFPRLVAAILDCSYGALVDHQKFYRQMRRVGAGSVAALALLALALAHQARQLSEANDSLRLEKNENLALEARIRLNAGDRLEALKTLYEAVPEEEASVSAAAQRTLQDAVDAYVLPDQADYVLAGEYGETESGDLAFSANTIDGEDYLAVLDKTFGTVKVWQISGEGEGTCLLEMYGNADVEYSAQDVWLSSDGTVSVQLDQSVYAASAFSDDLWKMVNAGSVLSVSKEFGKLLTENRSYSADTGDAENIFVGLLSLKEGSFSRLWTTEMSENILAASLNAEGTKAVIAVRTFKGASQSDRLVLCDSEGNQLASAELDLADPSIAFAGELIGVTGIDDNGMRILAAYDASLNPLWRTAAAADREEQVRLAAQEGGSGGEETFTLFTGDSIYSFKAEDGSEVEVSPCSGHLADLGRSGEVDLADSEITENGFLYTKRTDFDGRTSVAVYAAKYDTNAASMKTKSISGYTLREGLINTISLPDGCARIYRDEETGEDAVVFFDTYGWIRWISGLDHAYHKTLKGICADGGDRIVFAAQEAVDEEVHLYVLSAEDGEMKTFTIDAENAASCTLCDHSAFSHDSSGNVFRVDYDDPERGLACIYSNNEVEELGVYPSPDGSRILLVNEDVSSQAALMLSGEDGEILRNISGVNLAAGYQFPLIRDVFWSPDSSKCAIARFEWGSSSENVMIYNADGGAMGTKIEPDADGVGAGGRTYWKCCFLGEQLLCYDTNRTDPTLYLYSENGAIADRISIPENISLTERYELNVLADADGKTVLQAVADNAGHEQLAILGLLVWDEAKEGFSEVVPDGIAYAWERDRIAVGSDHSGSWFPHYSISDLRELCREEIAGISADDADEGAEYAADYEESYWQEVGES